MKYLIVDLFIQLDGHRYGFMNNLLQYVEKEIPQHHFTFLSNFSQDFILKKNSAHTKVLQLKQEEQGAIDACSGLISKAKKEWDFIDEYAKKHNADRVILMYLDTYLLEIGKRKTAYKISGIWLMPYPRIQAESNAIKERGKVVASKVRKKIAMEWALRNPNFDRVFILNDEEMPKWLNKGTKKRFFTLPDPYFKYPQIPDFNLRSRYNIPTENLIFLQFGYIDERKNMENIILAFNNLPKESAKKSTLLVVGKFKKGFHSTLENLKTANFQMILRDQFISDEEMECTFAQSDVILRMNVGFFGSSGIIGVAAAHNKPVVASNSGVMAELVEKYHLGDLVNPFDINAITKSLVSFHTQKDKREINGVPYRDSHNLESFARTLLSL